MDQIQHLLTTRVCDLIDRAEALRPDFPVAFEVMTNETDLLPNSAAAKTVTDSSGNEIIYIDLARVDEYTIGHEIMHLILHRSGWPQMYCIVPTELDPIARRLADSLDNSFDHFIFNPELEAQGFDVVQYREWFLSILGEWPDTQITGPFFLWNALKILDGLFFGGTFRTQVIEVVSSRQPECLKLARQLEHKASRLKSRTKDGTRRAMIAVLDYLEIWLTDKIGSQPNLSQRIGISPMFTKSQLRSRASAVVELVSHSQPMNSQQFWIMGFVLKQDGTRFRNYWCEGATSDPPLFVAIRQHLQTKSLEDFISAANITKFGTFP